MFCGRRKPQVIDATGLANSELAMQPLRAPNLYGDIVQCGQQSDCQNGSGNIYSSIEETTVPDVVQGKIAAEEQVTYAVIGPGLMQNQQQQGSLKSAESAADASQPVVYAELQQLFAKWTKATVCGAADE